VAALQATGELLTSHPEVGRPYRHTQTGIKLRALPVKKFGDWLLFYEVVESEDQRVVFIHRLLHGSWDIEALLE
jgi:plasmid stabilization system protein ParE